jgi:hypothetical protein
MRRGIIGLTAVLALAAFAPGFAHGAVSATSTVDFPENIQVGEEDIEATITITNSNTPPDTQNSLCHPGLNPIPPACTGTLGIALFPSCNDIAGATCADTEDVLRLKTGSGAALGEEASACGGKSFTVGNLAGDNSGGYSFVPGGSLNLEAGATCVIEFTIEAVDRMPSDGDTGAEALLVHSQYTSGGESSTSTATDEYGMTRGGPGTITGDASSAVNVGNIIYDAAHITGLHNALIDRGDLVFKLYPPNDPLCAGTPIFEDAQPAQGTGSQATAQSAPFITTEAGTYYWTAEYTGDLNNLPIPPTACPADVKQRVIVRPRPPAEPIPGGPGPVPAPGRTGKRAKGIKACKRVAKKKRYSKKRRKACLKKAKKFPL